jgi:hypothetical protein
MTTRKRDDNKTLAAVHYDSDGDSVALRSDSDNDVDSGRIDCEYKIKRKKLNFDTERKPLFLRQQILREDEDGVRMSFAPCSMNIHRMVDRVEGISVKQALFELFKPAMDVDQDSEEEEENTEDVKEDDADQMKTVGHPENSDKIEKWVKSLKSYTLSGNKLWVVRLALSGVVRLYKESKFAQQDIFKSLQMTFPNVKLDTDALGELGDRIGLYERTTKPLISIVGGNEQNIGSEDVTAFLHISIFDPDTQIDKKYHGICIGFDPIRYFTHPSAYLSLYDVKNKIQAVGGFPLGHRSIHYLDVPVGFGPFESCVTEEINGKHPLDDIPSWRRMWDYLSQAITSNLKDLPEQERKQGNNSLVDYERKQKEIVEACMVQFAESDPNFRKMIEATGKDTMLYWVDEFCCFHNANYVQEMRSEWLNVEANTAFHRKFSDCVNPDEKVFDVCSMFSMNLTEEDFKALYEIDKKWMKKINPEKPQPMAWDISCTICKQRIFNVYNKKADSRACALKYTWSEARDAVLHHYCDCYGLSSPNFALLKCYEEADNTRFPWFQTWFQCCCLYEAYELIREILLRKITIGILSKTGGFVKLNPTHMVFRSSDSDSNSDVDDSTSNGKDTKREIKSTDFGFCDPQLNTHDVVDGLSMEDTKREMKSTDFNLVQSDVDMCFDLCDPQLNTPDVVDGLPIGRALRIYFDVYGDYPSDAEYYSDCDKQSEDSDSDADQKDCDIDQKVGYTSPMTKPGSTSHEVEDPNAIKVWFDRVETKNLDENLYWVVCLPMDSIVTRFTNNISAQRFIFAYLQSKLPNVKLQDDFSDLHSRLGLDKRRDHDGKNAPEMGSNDVNAFLQVCVYGPDDQACTTGICLGFEAVNAFDLNPVFGNDAADSVLSYFPSHYFSTRIVDSTIQANGGTPIRSSCDYFSLPCGHGPFEAPSLRERDPSDSSKSIHPLDVFKNWRKDFHNVLKIFGVLLERFRNKLILQKDEPSLLDYAYELESLAMFALQDLPKEQNDKLYYCLKATGKETPLYVINKFCVADRAYAFELQRASILHVEALQMAGPYPLLATFLKYNQKVFDVGSMLGVGITKEDEKALADIEPQWMDKINPLNKQPMMWKICCGSCGGRIFNTPNKSRPEPIRYTWLKARNQVLEHYCECFGFGHPNMGLLKCYELGMQSHGWFSDWFNSCCLLYEENKKLAKELRDRKIIIGLLTDFGSFMKLDSTSSFDESEGDSEEDEGETSEEDDEDDATAEEEDGDKTTEEKDGDKTTEEKDGDKITEEKDGDKTIEEKENSAEDAEVWKCPLGCAKKQKDCDENSSTTPSSGAWVCPFGCAKKQNTACDTSYSLDPSMSFFPSPSYSPSTPIKAVRVLPSYSPSTPMTESPVCPSYSPFTP